MDIKNNTQQIRMRSRPLIFLDLEATSLEVQRSEIIEIGALKVQQRTPFKILAEFSSKVMPKNIDKADGDALKVVGYSKEEWQEAIDLKKALGELDKFAKDGILVGYNVSFDWALLDKAYFALGRQDPFYYHRVDVMAIAFAKLFSKRSIKRFSLGEICRYLKVKRATQHRALSDTLATYQAFVKLMAL